MKNRIQTLFCLLGAIFPLGICTETTAAQIIDGKFRLNAEIPIFRYSSATIKYEDSDQESDRTKTGVGLLESIGFGLGYALSENIVLGCTLMAYYQSDSQEDEIEIDGNEMAFSFGPIIEYIISIEGNIRPAIGLGLAVSMMSASAEASGEALAEASAGEVKLKETDFDINGVVGAHAFVTESFSIDPFIWFTYRVGFGTKERPDESVDLDANGIIIGFGAQLSGWM